MTDVRGVARGTVESIRSVAARVLRATSNVPGTARVARLLNKVALALGGAPIVLAPMNNGTRLYVDLRTLTERDAYFTGRYDDELLDVVFRVADVDAALLDVGANIGFYMTALGCHIRRHLGAGRVFGFEPFQGNHARAVENIELNGIQDVCQVLNFGLSDLERSGYLILREDFQAGARTGNASIASDPTFDEGFNGVSITLKALDTVWPALGGGQRIDLIKVDIEGHEDQFLAGATETLRKHRPTILLEVNKPYYVARTVRVDDVLAPQMPRDYAVLRWAHRKWVEISSFEECAELDNVFLVPRERLDIPRYQEAFGAN